MARFCVRRGKARHGGVRQGRGYLEIELKTVKVEIRGTSPLLVHRFSEDAEQAKATRQMQVNVRDPREEATRHAYIAQDGTYYINAFSIPGCMGNAGSNHKAKGSRKSLRFIVPSAVRMTTDAVTILNGSGPAKSFEVDSALSRSRRRRAGSCGIDLAFRSVGAQVRSGRQRRSIVARHGAAIASRSRAANRDRGLPALRSARPFGCFLVSSWKVL